MSRKLTKAMKKCLVAIEFLSPTLFLKESIADVSGSSFQTGPVSSVHQQCISLHREGKMCDSSTCWTCSDLGD